MRFKTKQSAVDYFYNTFYWKRSEITEDRILDPQIIIDSGLEAEVADDDVFVASEKYPCLYFQPTGERVLRLDKNGKVHLQHIYKEDYWKDSVNVQYEYMRPLVHYEDGSTKQPNVVVHKYVGEIFGKYSVDPEKHKKEDGTFKMIQYHHLKSIEHNGYRDTVGVTDDVHHTLEKVKTYSVWFGPRKGFKRMDLGDLLVHISCERSLDFFIDFVRRVYEMNVAGNKEIYERDIVAEDEIIVPIRYFFPSAEDKKEERYFERSYRIRLVFKKQNPKKRKNPKEKKEAS